MPRVLLTGFAGSGKSTVGPLAAEALGAPFVDLDALVEERTGQTIPAIFERSGESEFRRIERALALEVLARTGPAVVSSGGGTLLDGEVRRVAMGSFRVVALHVTAETAVARIGQGGVGRPLLAGGDPVAQARELLTLREGLYRLAHAGLWTEGRTPAALAREIVAFERGEAVAVSLGARSYPVWAGRGVLAQAASLIEDAGLGARSLALICDRGVSRRWGGPLARSLARRTRRLLRVVQAPGEARKNVGSAARLTSRLIKVGWERTDPVVALGGGMVGDLAGFVAATLLRGVPFVQVPTTLLAQADASIGGKVAIDHPGGKNLIGAFHQPRLVIADLDTLETLPRRQLRAGLAEVVKCGVIRDETILDRIEAAAEVLARGAIEPLEEPLRRAIAVKAGVVSRDEREAGERRILNFGHTVGHAIEAAQHYRGHLHGEAVAIGMVAALRIGVARGVTPAPLVRRVEAVLSRLGLPTELPETASVNVLRQALTRDKKARGGRVRMVLAAGGGRTEELSLTPEEIVEAVGAGRKLGAGRSAE